MRYFLDLFAGIGGFAIGAEWAGMTFDGHYFSEVDEYAISVYQHRFPDAINLGDIRTIGGGQLPSGEWIIAGGFPCQDISVAGKGAGLDGGRSGLWFEYARIIGELRPRFAIMENVGALTIRGLDRVLGSLAALGYDAEWQDIRAADVGAPHRRERIWIVGYPNGQRLEELADGFAARARDVDGECRRENGADSGHDGTVERIRKLRDYQQNIQRGQNNGRGAAINESREWWAVEPDVGRVAHGIPARVDRLKCLGNSIVPQIAELIFREIRKQLEAGL